MESKISLKKWYCNNYMCNKIIGYECQPNKPCWHFCETCMKEKKRIRNNPVKPHQVQHMLKGIKTCVCCNEYYCQGCTYWQLFKDSKYIFENTEICKKCYKEKAIDFFKTKPSAKDPLEAIQLVGSFYKQKKQKEQDLLFQGLDDDDDSPPPPPPSSPSLLDIKLNEDIESPRRRRKYDRKKNHFRNKSISYSPVADVILPSVYPRYTSMNFRQPIQSYFS